MSGTVKNIEQLSPTIRVNLLREKPIPEQLPNHSLKLLMKIPRPECTSL